MGDFQDESFGEMEARFDARYEILEKAAIGEGAYGRVYKARQLNTGRVVAMKKMKLDQEDEGIPSTAIREIALLKELAHENVVRLLDIFCSTAKLTLVFEFVDNDLKTYMKSLRGQHLSPDAVRRLTFQLCRGIEFCHASRILHRDLKPQNLLIDGRLRLKIADFGLARAYTLPVPKYTHEVVTVWYRAPEILLGCSLYSVPVDLWSVGCVMGEMATGQPLFPGDSEIGTLFKVFQKLGTPSPEAWPGIAEVPEFKPSFPRWRKKGWENIRNTKSQIGAEGIDLLDRLMMYDPKKRLSARRALQHHYFAEIDRGTVSSERR